MGKTYNVLVFPAGEVNSVELHAALSVNVNINVFGASSVDRHGGYVFKNYISNLPHINKESFLEELNKLIEKWNIDVVIPTHDTVVLYFARHRDKINSKVLVPSFETAQACRDKEYAYDIFQGFEFVPDVYKNLDQIIDGEYFVKPKEGQGSVGARKLTLPQADPVIIDFSKEIVCEYLPGKELTVDCFTNYKNELMGVFPRERTRTFGGISMAGNILKADEHIYQIAEAINNRLGFVGMWFFQLKQSKKGAWKLLEISSRCSGGQCLTRARGVNLPLLSVYTILQRDVTIVENDYHVNMDRTLLNKFKINIEYDTVYLDFDDCLIINKSVNLEMIRLLYQFKNANIKVVLLTKHDGNVEEALRTYCISKNLFTKIVHLDVKDEKWKYIESEKSIFIDNSFAERLMVAKKTSIPTFDVDTTEVLHSWIR